MVINSSGNVGIGTGNPQYGKLQIKTASAIGYTPTSFMSGTNLRLSTGGTAATNITTGVSMGVGGAAEAYIGAVQNSSNYADIVFQTYHAAYGERMRITSAGRILMLGLDGKTQTHPDVSYRLSDGELFYQTSSERYKTDIVNLESSLNKINSLRPVRFTDINTNEPGFGLIAEETNEVIPDVVFSKDDQIEGISYSNLTPFLIKAIQELKAEVETLKNQINGIN